MRPCSFGLGSYSSANGEATGQTDQGDEVRFRSHQCQAGPKSERTVSISFTVKQFCEVSFLDSEFVSFQGDQTSKEDTLMRAFLLSSTPTADETREETKNSGNQTDVLRSGPCITSQLKYQT